MTKQFAGEWTIARSISDRERSTEITCVGSARLLPNDDMLVYHEAVSFELAGKIMRATRTFGFGADDGSIVATFADGSPFFRVRLDAAGRGTALHHCGDDLYTLSLTLSDATSWRTQWDISGTKSVRIITDYVR